MTRSILLVFLFLTFGLSLSAQTTLYGAVMDPDGNPLDFATVSIEKEGTFTGATADMDGNYSISLDPGTYKVTFSMLGFQEKVVTGVIVLSGATTKLDAQLSDGTEVLQDVIVTAYKVPLISDGGGSAGFTAKQMSKLPSRDILGAVGTVPGINLVDDGSGDINAKGARSNSTVFYLDGVRIRGSLPPASEIEQLEVMTGGVDAKYGDTGGGIMSVITKGPSSKFSGSFEGESSQYLDPYGFNLGYLSAAGPIITKTEGKNKKTILGFRVSGQYRIRKDDRPSIVPIYVASDEAKAKSEKNPVYTRNNSVFSSAERYTTIGKEGESGVDIWKLDYRPDEEDRNIATMAKLDARLTDNFQMTLTGTYTDDKDKFTPFGWQFMNSHHNPTINNKRYRGIFRIRHKLGNWNATEEEKAGLFRNFSYTILGSFERREYDRKDAQFGEDLFAYGHAGVGDFKFVPTLQLSQEYVEGADSAALNDGRIGYYFHNGYAPVFQGYTPSTFNPGLSAYNQGGDTGRQNLLRPNGVALNSNIDNIWNQLQMFNTPLYKNANQVYNRYNYGSQDLVSGEINIAFDIRRSKEKKEDKKRLSGNHSINMGFQYEERAEKNYNLRPQDLWVIAGNVVNSSLQGVDRSVILGVIDTVTESTNATIRPIKYGAKLDDGFADNKHFFKAIRDKFDIPYTEWVNISGYTPDQLSMDMFAGSEVIGSHVRGNRTLDYYGYDFLGNPVNRSTSFNDFFKSKDKFGNNNYPVAPARPIYLGGYIQDKFIYDHMIFKVGVRVDRYDANTKVLKDKYSMYEIQGAGTFHAIAGTKDKPANIGDDYKVYVTSNGGKTVKAYRKGDQWYYPSGGEATGGNVIFGGGVVVPSYLDNNGGLIDKPINIKEKDFDPDRSFKDYEPQWDVSPRLSFSFPISDKANFFAHYDVYAQRPTSNTIMTALDYYNFFNDVGEKNNPALKTQKSIDYAVGFQQQVSKTSSIKLTTFYQELRNLVQRRTISYVPIAGNYITYDNIDFSTTKGFTFQYDMRRTKNTSLYLTYTLQFVNGTGSDANSSSGLASRGIIRTTSPLAFDQRHTIQALLDYRYKANEGPRVFGKHIFQNAGVNFLVSSYSGRPYTAKKYPLLYSGAVTTGALNGARKPWSYTLGMRIDKDFTISKKGSNHPLFFNVYFRAENLLNTANVLDVYSATGSPVDDGYLTTLEGAGGVSSIRNSGQSVESYLNFYNWGLEDPSNFVLPRRMYVGLSFNF